MNTTLLSVVAKKTRPFLLLLLFAPCVAVGQATPKTVEVSNLELTKVLASVESFSTYKSTHTVAQVYVVSNGSGSARLPESDEISHSLLVSLSEYGEHPVSRLFRIGPLMNPKIVDDQGIAKGNYVMVTEGLASARKTHKMSFIDGRVIYE